MIKACKLWNNAKYKRNLAQYIRDEFDYALENVGPKHLAIYAYEQYNYQRPDAPLNEHDLRCLDDTFYCDCKDMTNDGRAGVEYSGYNFLCTLEGLCGVYAICILFSDEEITFPQETDTKLYKWYGEDVVMKDVCEFFVKYEKEHPIDDVKRLNYKGKLFDDTDLFKDLYI